MRSFKRTFTQSVTATLSAVWMAFLMACQVSPSPQDTNKLDVTKLDAATPPKDNITEGLNPWGTLALMRSVNASSDEASMLIYQKTGDFSEVKLSHILGTQEIPIIAGLRSTIYGHMFIGFIMPVLVQGQSCTLISLDILGIEKQTARCIDAPFRPWNQIARSSIEQIGSTEEKRRPFVADFKNGNIMYPTSRQDNLGQGYMDVAIVKPSGETIRLGLYSDNKLFGQSDTGKVYVHVVNPDGSKPRVVEIDENGNVRDLFSDSFLGEGLPIMISQNRSIIYSPLGDAHLRMGLSDAIIHPSNFANDLKLNLSPAQIEQTRRSDSLFIEANEKVFMISKNRPSNGIVLSQIVPSYQEKIMNGLDSRLIAYDQFKHLIFFSTEGFGMGYQSYIYNTLTDSMRKLDLKDNTRVIVAARFVDENKVLVVGNLPPRAEPGVYEIDLRDDSFAFKRATTSVESYRLFSTRP